MTTGAPLPAPRISLVHLVALAVFIAVGCMIGLFVLVRHKLIMPPARQQSGIVRIHLVENSAPPSQVAPAQPNRDAAPPPQPAAVPAAAGRAARPLEAPAPGRRESGAASGMALPQPPSGALFQTPSSETVADFQRRLLDHIALYRRYPPGARGSHLQGRVLVTFVMNRDGTVRSAVIEDGSGVPVLDQEALDTVRRAQPLPTIPASLADHLKIMLPVEFSAP